MLQCPTEIQQNTPSTRGLVWAGIGSLAVYVAFALFYWESVEPFTPLIRQLFSWLAVLLLLFFYWRGYRSLKQNASGKLKVIIWAALAFSVVALLIQPFDSRDMFGYINRGWQQAHYGLNPYTTVIRDIPQWQSDPMLTDHWIGNPCPYGFLFAHIAKILCWLGNGQFLSTLLLFKGMNIVIHGAIGALLWFGTKRLNLPRPDLTLYLYLWNPLIVMHHLANGHNDLLMAFFSLLGVYLAVVGAWLWVIPAFVAGTLVKYAVGVVLPFVLVFIVRQQGWRKATLSVLAGLILLGVVGSSYVQDWSQFQFAEIGSNATVSTNSLHSVFYDLFDEIADRFPLFEEGLSRLSDSLKVLLWLGFAMVFMQQLLRSIREKAFSRETFIERTLLIQFLLVCVVSTKFYPWYIGMFFPFAFLLHPSRRLKLLVLLISGAQLLAFTFIGKAHMLNYILMTGVPIWWVFWGKNRIAKSLAHRE